MASNYTGSPTATQAPAAAPAPDGAPIGVLPADGDPPNAAAFAQAYKVCLDYLAWLFKPRAKLTDIAKEIMSFRNGLLNRRAGYDHQGYPGGLWAGFDEDWCDNTFAAKTVAGTGLWGRSWTYQVGVTGGTLAGGGISVIDQTVGGGGSITGPLCPLLSTNAFPNAAATAWVLVEATMGKAVTSPDSALVLEWSGQPGGTGWSVGIANASQVGLSAENNGMIGLAVFRRTADTHYQLYTNDGTTTTFTDTGIAVGSASRFRLEYQGANQADGGSAIASVILDGTTLVSKVVNLGSFIGKPYLRGWSATNGPGGSTMGPLRFRSNLFPGDHFI
jgi:hypothetical protein